MNVLYQLPGLFNIHFNNLKSKTKLLYECKKLKHYNSFPYQKHVFNNPVTTISVFDILFILII